MHTPFDVRTKPQGSTVAGAAHRQKFPPKPPGECRADTASLTPGGGFLRYREIFRIHLIFIDIFT
jgi:hypothetical protein